MFLGYSNECKKVIERAKGFALASGGLLGTEHLIAGMLSVPESPAGQMLKNVGLDVDKYMHTIRFSSVKQAMYQISARVQNVCDSAIREAKASGQTYVSSMDLLYKILQDQTSFAVKNIAAQGLDIDLIINNITAAIDSQNNGYDDSTVEFEQPEPTIEIHTSGDVPDELQDMINSFSKTLGGFGQPQQRYNKPGKEKGDPKLKGLDKYGVDLTAKARAGKLDPVVGRKEEVDRIIQILSRRTKNNPVLIGEPGVGKSAIVEGLAQAIVKGDVPEMLKNKIIFSLDITSMVAGAKYRGEFEERIKDAIDIVKNNPNIILFIDEIHMIVGAGATGEDGNMDAANILKPQLARGELQTIGATTIEEYRKHIEKDAALERRFQPIMVEPPSVEDTIPSR